MIELSLNAEEFDEDLWRQWRNYIPQDAQLAYLYLSARCRAGCRPFVNMKEFAGLMGDWSQARLQRALEWLDREGLISLLEDE